MQSKTLEPNDVTRKLAQITASLGYFYDVQGQDPYQQMLSKDSSFIL